ncbi:hypothetical protein [Clostridium rectalis]|uniref:hypothetical protein n=1 Tax=Clostridium rectalis TaxID=2040295 RepID=UPI000F63FD41|nr:hypothetical protein [Clostridium rectalis]
MEETKISDIRRIANSLKIIDINEDKLCLKIQSEIQKLKQERDKLKFVNIMLVNENKKQESNIKILKNKNRKKNEVELNNTYNKLKNENNELNIAINGLKKEIQYYKDYIRKNKIA